jgi:hypothetical protein
VLTAIPKCDHGGHRSEKGRIDEGTAQDQETHPGHRGCTRRVACVLLLAADRVLKIGGRPPISAPAIAVARVLGARQLVQSAVTAVAPTWSVAGLRALVDALHAGTNVGIAAMSPRWRRTALTDALIAAGFAVSGRSCGSRTADRSPRR